MSELDNRAAAEAAADLEATLLAVYDHGDVGEAEEAEARAEARQNLAPELLKVYTMLADGPVAQPCHSWSYADGSRWGYPGGLIRKVSWPHRCEYLLSLDPEDSNILRVGRNPDWPRGRRYFELQLEDPDLRRQVLMLTDCLDPWSEVMPDPEWLYAAGPGPEADPE